MNRRKQQGPRRRWLVTVLAAFLAARLTAGPVPEWCAPDFTRRLVINPRAALDPNRPGGSHARPGACLLVRLPGEPATGSVAVLTGAGIPVPFGVVSGGLDTQALLLQLGTNPAPGELAVYYRPDTNAVVTGHAPDPALRDPAPVALRALRPPGMGAPTGWEELRTLQAHAGNADGSGFLAAIGELEAPPLMADVRTILACPTAGVYRFALGGMKAAGLVIDGALAVQAFNPYARATDPWVTGPPVQLAAGLHTLWLLAWVPERQRLRIGWQPPGATAVAAIPADAAVAAFEAELTRPERSDRTLQPEFSVQVDKPYVFAGRGDYFVPVRLRQSTRNWLNAGGTATWTVDGRTVGVDKPEDSIRTVLVGAVPHTLQLTVRDKLGFTATTGYQLAAPVTLPQLYGVSAVLDLRASVCYPGDEVDPVIRIAGTAPADSVFTLRVRSTVRTGPRPDTEQDISLKSGSATVRLTPFAAGNVAQLAWSLEHAGASLAGEDVRFVMPPSTIWPARVTADRLYDAGGRRLVLVAADSARARTQARITTAQAFGRIVCIDDYLRVGGPVQARGADSFDRELARLVDGPDLPIVLHAPLPDWSAAAAYGPLLKFIDVPAALSNDSDVAILSLGLRDLLRVRNAAVFEREIAALTDHVNGDLRVPVVWLTPPAFPALADELRPYALAIRRVAAARHIPVADLYTAFQDGPDAAGGWFAREDLALTEAGQHRVARLLARALLQEPP